MASGGQRDERPLTFLTDDELALAAPRRLRMLETSPITCIGGKGRGQVLQLALFLPSRFGSFYEPFMGGMNMSNLLIKEGWISPNKCRASDKCKELVAFFVTLQTHAEPLAKALLADRQLHGSSSRELFAEARAAIAEAASRLSVARGFYLHNRMAFLAIRDFESANRYSPTLVASAGLTEKHVLRLLLFAANLTGVRIQRRGYQTALTEAVEDVDPFVFLDPPYEAVEQAKSYKGHDQAMYRVSFDFDLFAHCVHAVNSKVKFLITINDGEVNRKRQRVPHGSAAGVLWFIENHQERARNYEL
jgi:site-specific DNA-adenine methylase